MKRHTKQTLFKIISAVLIVCFAVYDVAWALPGVNEAEVNTLAQGTLFTADKDAFQKVFTGWAERGGLDMFADNSVAAAETFLREIGNRESKTSNEKDDVLNGIPNGARHGQFFIVNGDNVIRCFDPNMSQTFPIYDFKIIWDFSANRYLRFQMLERLDRADRLILNFGVYMHQIDNAIMGPISWASIAKIKISLKKREPSEQVTKLEAFGEELSKCREQLLGKQLKLRTGGGKLAGIDKEEKEQYLIISLKEFVNNLVAIRTQIEKENFTGIDDDNKRLPEQFIRILNFAIIKINTFLENRGEVDTEGIRKNVEVSVSLQAASEYFWGKGQKVEFDLAKVPQVNIDEGLLLEVWMNLFKNAFQAMGKSGKVYVHTGFDKKLDEVIVSVRDEGPGIPENIRDKIFDRSFTTKGDRGKGIGLWLCRQIIETAGGAIDRQTVEGEGTTFIVRLPAVNSGTDDLKRTDLSERHVIKALDLIREEFKGDIFTYESFVSKSSMSYAAACNTLLCLRRLGVLEHLGTEKKPGLRIRKCLYMHEDLMNDVNIILSGLYTDPNGDEIAKARMEIDSLIHASGTERIVKTVKTGNLGDVVDTVATFWPERDLTQFEINDIKKELTETEELDLYDAMDRISRRTIDKQGKVHIGRFLDSLNPDEVDDLDRMRPAKLSAEHRGKYVPGKRSVEEVWSLIKTLEKLPAEHKWITGIVLGNWQEYFKVIGTKDMTEDEKTEVISKGRETFFSLLPEPLKSRLSSEYDNMLRNGGIMIFPDFLSELWPENERFDYQEKIKDFRKFRETVKSDIEAVLFGKAYSSEMFEVHKRFINGEMEIAKKIVESIADNYPRDEAAYTIYADMISIIELKKKLASIETLIAWDQFFRQDKDIKAISRNTDLPYETLKSHIGKFNDVFYGSLTAKTRRCMIRLGVEKVYVFSRDDKVAVFREDKWREIADRPGINKKTLNYIRNKSELITIDRDGYGVFPERFNKKFGNIDSVILIKDPETRVMVVRPSPELLSVNMLYNTANIRSKGDILRGLETILDNNELLSSSFTREQFRAVRKKIGAKVFSYTTASNELEYLRELGILEKDDSSREYRYALKDEIKKASLSYISKIKFIISKLPTDPSEEQLLEAKKLIDGTGIPASFKKPDRRILKKETDILLYYLNELPKYNLKLIRLYTERAELESTREGAEASRTERLAECSNKINVLKRLIEEEFDEKKYPPAEYSPDLTFKRKYRMDVREKVSEALRLIDEKNEPAACSVLNSALSLIGEEYSILVNSGEIRKRKRGIRYDRSQNKYVIPQGHRIKRSIPGDRSVYKWEKGENKFDLLWQGARSMDKTLNGILSKIDWIRSVLPEINGLIERLEKYKENKTDDVPGNNGKRSVVVKTLLTIGNEWQKTFVKEKDIAAYSSQLAIDLLNMNKFESMLEILRTVRSMMTTRLTSLETQAYSISNGRLKDLRYSIQSRNEYFRGKLKKLLMMIEQDVDAKPLKREFFTIVNDRHFKNEPEFFRMEGVLRGVKDNILNKKNIDDVRLAIKKVQQRLAAADLLNVFMTDLRDVYVDGRISGEGEEYFKEAFEKKFIQYLEYAKENNIGRGSPRLLWTWFYLAAHPEISMKLPDPKKDLLERKDDPLFKSIQFLIRILEINDMHRLVSFFENGGYGNDDEFFGIRKKKKRKYDHFYDQLNKLYLSEYVEIDSIDTEEYKRLIKGISEDFMLDAEQKKMFEQMAQEQETFFKEAGLEIEARKIEDIKKDRMRCLEMILSDSELRSEQFSAGDYYNKMIDKFGKKGFRGRWASVAFEELKDLALLGILDTVNAPGPYAPEYKLNKAMLNVNEYVLDEIRTLMREAPERPHKKDNVTHMYGNRIREVLKMSEERLREVRNKQIAGAKQMSLWEDDKGSSGSGIAALKKTTGTGIKEKLDKVNGKFGELLTILAPYRRDKDITGIYLTGAFAKGALEDAFNELDIGVRLKNSCEHEELMTETGINMQVRQLNKKSDIKFNITFLSGEKSNVPEEQRLYRVLEKDLAGVDIVEKMDDDMRLLDFTRYVDESKVFETNFLSVLYGKILEGRDPLTRSVKTTVNDVLMLIRNTKDESPETKKCVLIDKDLGQGRIEEIVEALSGLSRTADPGKQSFYRNMEFLPVEINKRELDGIKEHKSVDMKDMIIISGIEKQMKFENDGGELKDYGNISLVGLVDESEFNGKSYYPILDIVKFILARTEIYGYTENEILDLYRKIPFVDTAVSGEEMKKMCRRKIILIKLVLPGSRAVSADAFDQKEIADYIRTQA